MFLPLTSHNPVPSHTWNCQQIVDQRLKVLRIFRSKFEDVDPTDSLWTPAWGPNHGKVAVEVVEIKKAKRRAKMKPANIELQKVKKIWRFEQAKKGSLRYRGPLVHWMNVVVVVRVKSNFFLPFSVLLFTSFVFKTRWLTVKEIFLLTSTWLVCKGDEATLLILMSNWLKCAMHSMPNRQHSARMTASGTFSSLLH